VSELAGRSLTMPTPESMRALGRWLAGLVRPGDLLVLAGPLGAGKTVFVQGLASGLGVTAPVTSPTFVLAREHRDGQLPLLHVDAYRLGSLDEVEDLDLDVEGSVTAVEWGAGLVEGLTDGSLLIRIDRAEGEAVDESRTVRLEPSGAEWRRRLEAVDVSEPAAVLCDLDGVLVNSTASVEKHWTEFAEAHGLDVQAVLAVAHGRPARALIAEVMPGEDIDALAAELEARETADAEGSQPLPGAAALLGELRDSRLAVVTSGTAPVAAARLEATGLRPPPVFVTADQLTKGKPDPEPYLTAARRLGVPADRCLVIEDAPAGITAGRAAGARVLALLTTHSADALTGSAAPPDLLAADLASVLATADGAVLVNPAPNGRL
jgi:tRNA threonylcarbamoyl adenosine modification protein YjeE